MQPLQALSLTLLSLLAVDAQTFHSGKCPVPSLQQDFSVAQYLGRWYEIEKFPAVFQKGTCSQATYSLNSDGTVKVLNEELLSDGSVGAIEGYAKVVDPSEPAKLEVVFFEGGPPGKYWVLSTDYDSYSLVYSCTDYEGLFHVEFAWILSRTRSLPGETITRLHETLTSQGISIDKITVTEQAGCSVMPE